MKRTQRSKTGDKHMMKHRLAVKVRKRDGQGKVIKDTVHYKLTLYGRLREEIRKCLEAIKSQTRLR